MLYDTTTYYNLQALQGNTTRRAWASPAASASGSKFGPVRAVAAFSGVGGTLHPYPRRFRASWALLRGLGVVPGLPRREWRCWPARPPGAVGLPPGVQPVVFPPALSVDVRHGLGKPLFPAKPLFAAFQRARRWMRAQAMELPPARRAAPLANSLAVGQHDCRRGSRRSRGNPAGVPRRRRRPTL